MLNVNQLTGFGASAAAYTTWNPSDKSSAITLSAGNLVVTHAAVDSVASVRSTVGKSSGKWYWEVTMTALGGNNNSLIGVMRSSTPVTSYPGADTAGYSYYGLGGTKYYNAVSTTYGATYTVGDVIGVALDMDAGTLTFYKNNVSQGVAFTWLSGTYYAAHGCYYSNEAISANFGASALTYSPPAGFNAGLYI